MEERLTGQEATPGLLDEAAELTVGAARADNEDVHADAAYRARVSGVLVRRALEEMAS